MDPSFCPFTTPGALSVSAVSSLAFTEPCSSTLPVKSPGPMRLGALAVMSWLGLHRARFDLSLANLVGVEEVIGFPAELLLVIMIEKLTRFDYRPLLNVRVRNGVGDHHPD